MSVFASVKRDRRQEFRRFRDNLKHDLLRWRTEKIRQQTGVADPAPQASGVP